MSPSDQETASPGSGPEQVQVPTGLVRSGTDAVSGPMHVGARFTGLAVSVSGSP